MSEQVPGAGMGVTAGSGTAADGRWARLLPVLGWWSTLRNRRVLRADLLAGVTVAIVTIPQALAYAQLAGLPPYLGLYAALLPCLVAALWGSCAQLSTGPVALTSLLVSASIAPLAVAGDPRLLAAAILLAIMSGLLQLAAGLLRVGPLVERVPAVVVLGFVNAAALMIAASQLPALLGVAGPREPDLWHTVLAIQQGLPAMDRVTAAFGVLAWLALLAMRRIHPKFPGALVVSVAAILISRAIGYEAIGGQVIGDLPAGLPALALPAPDLPLMVLLLPATLTVALVSFIEVLSSSRAICAKTGHAWDVDRELVGQGLAKIASGLSGAFPVSGSFSRSALNYASHATTPLASIASALLVAVALVFATGALHHLPRAVLSAVIVLAVINLFSPGQLLALWRSSRRDALVALTTFIATLVSAPHIHYGLLAGIVASVLLHWRR